MAKAAGVSLNINFPQFQKFPSELQINVWLAAFQGVSGKPSVQFVGINIAAKLHDKVCGMWQLSLKASTSAGDDSAS